MKDEKIIHAAKIMAQYLDNNEDGKVDNQAVVDKLTSVNATLIMFETELEAETSNYKIPDHGHIQGLWDDETIPSFNKNFNLTCKFSNSFPVLTKFIQKYLEKVKDRKLRKLWIMQEAVIL